ncbi:response regulator transcription factor [Actinomadura soli]|uniref:Response regulator transcription factor n=1 Tax=Actinomadura soli TaxID=2508997 RepID=A0A5C4J7B3_9ACTN|nr:response regulator transcription factor [Actinomadura soli]TMQ92219.1 response regulator transcription factor [Actinomadura soli]
MNNQSAPDGGPPAPPEPAHVPLLLVADPDETLGRELVLALAERGIEVTVSTDGAQALLRTGSLHPDVVLLAAGISAVDPVTFVRAVRASLPIPVIIGVGANDADKAVQALAAGANVCVARPYRLPELLPLIQSIRAENTPADAGNQPLTCGSIALDPVAHVVRIHGKTVHMPLREFELLHYMMLHADRVISRSQIQAHVWRSDKLNTNTINVHIRRLREKLGDDPDNPNIILTVRGVGYRLTTDTQDNPHNQDSQPTRQPS